MAKTFTPTTLLAVILLMGLGMPVAAQPVMTSDVAFTPAPQRMASATKRQQLRASSLVNDVPFRNVGPAVMSGRVADIDADPADPTHFYVAYASGGLWETTNNGQSFMPLFDHQATMTIGDIAVDWARGTIWVGTGENNSSRSSYAGSGVYRSSDGGASWEHLGLEESHHTGRIILHPDDPSTLWVAMLGHLYSPNPERGVYKSTDGGSTWRKTLFVDNNTGAIDLIADPTNPNTLYASMWHRERRAWNFVESGPGSGLYKSTDGGETWALLTTGGSGFPTGDGVGRIGIDVYPQDPNILYALLDNQDRRPVEEEEEAPTDALTRDALRTMDQAAFLALGVDSVEAFLRDEGFPRKYTGESVVKMVQAGELEPLALVEYLEDANSQLFNTPVIGAEVYRSADGGRSWQKMNAEYIDRLYNSYGYYFGEVRVAPDTPDRIYIMGVPILMSEDGGLTYRSIGGPHVHADHQALWVNPGRPGHLINGNDGGVNLTYDNGDAWFKANTPPVGQFYAIQVDDAEPYNVYGGLQDNGVWYGPSTYESSYNWYDSGNYPYDRLMGGDGMQIEVDTRTNDIVYTGFQFGFYSRISTSTGARMGIRPQHELGDRPLRFNWQTPIHLSRHNQDILYYGSNKLHRSMNQGEGLQEISGDLTRGGRPGDVPFGTLTSIDESPLQFGLLYVGSDDGYVHMTPDGGVTWQRISDALPQHLWVSRVEASNHDKDRVYVTLNGYRWDHFDAYVYRSDNRGTTWTRLGLDLPPEPVNVIIEDPVNPDVLYVGSDHGLYVSLDRGASFMGWQGGMPDAPVHDLKIQAREHELAVGTHGRSIFIGSIAEVQSLTPERQQEAVFVYAPDEVRHSTAWGRQFASWQEPFAPEMKVMFYAREAGTVTLAVRKGEATLKSWDVEAVRGLNQITYDLSIDADQAEALKADDQDAPEPADDGKTYLVAGTYDLVATRGGASSKATLMVTTRRGGGNAEPLSRPGAPYRIK